ncbi:MAG: 1-deoxy-D-xylulose-5-phosphate reductoisomerase [Lentisphaerae bacterium]|nr:1-deoxy-D-xylulose-5-phosphate reductoisomerase [Lentisphaerota bacterium]
MKKKVVVLGSSGSIGKNTVKVLEMFSDRFEVAGLAVKSSVELLAEQAHKLNCRNLVTADQAGMEKLKTLVPEHTLCRCGESALVDLVTQADVDIVVCAIVGTGGLLPVLAALRANKRVALASKEVMVMAGSLVNGLLDKNCGCIIPVDSEHSAIFQCLNGRDPQEVEKLVITASGGAFRDWSAEQLEKATWRDALKHPVWSMGSKITIDSATLMNKALEIVEAGYLFRVNADKIDVVLHKQSLVHSMIKMVDGSLIAQLSQPDMRFAIQYALTYPERFNGQLPQLDWQQTLQLDFALPDRRKYPSIDFAYNALRIGGTMPAVMNAANEIAVEHFCSEAITLPQIWQCVEAVMNKHNAVALNALEDALTADREARIAAEEFIAKIRR